MTVASPAPVSLPVSRLPDGGRFAVLDAWRGVAALMVAAYHVEGGGPLFQSAIVRGGWLFVDFFFVLSGFVLAAAYRDKLAGGFGIGRFMMLRLGRVYPLHLFVLSVYVAQELVLLLAQPEGLALREAFTDTRTPGLLVATLLLVQAFLVPFPNTWSAQSWTIAVEVWLYLLLAIVLRVTGPRGWIVLGLLALGALAMLEFPAAGWWQTPVSPLVARGLAGFGLGVVCWQLWPHVRPHLAALGEPVMSALELAAVALALGVVTDPGEGYIAIDAAFALLLLVFAAERGWLSRLLATTPFVWLGILSYSIYMVHGQVLGRGADLLRLAGLGELVMVDGVPIRRIAAPPLVSDLIAIVLLGAAVAAAWVTWRLVESPARRWSRRRAEALGAGAEEHRAPTL